MKKKSKLLVLGSFSLVFLLTFVFLNYNKDVNADSTDPAQERSEEEVTEEFLDGAKVVQESNKESWLKAINMAKGQQQLTRGVSDNQLQKWVVRAVMEKEVVGEKIEINEAVKIAKEKLEYETAWLEIATKDYNIIYTDNEIDDWIANGPDQNPVPAMYEQAEALGITLKEMNHTYDRDFYVKWVVWESLQPKLAEKYDVDLDAQYQPGEPSSNTILVNYYDQEVKDYLKK